jgi:integration host factor subunit alpha
LIAIWHVHFILPPAALPCILEHPMALTKVDIIDSVAEHNGYSKKEATDKVETLLEIIKRTLAFGEDVLVSGFGKFNVKEKTQRRGRNPATGEAMMLKPRRVVTFKCSGKLRRKINTKRV